MAIFSSVVNVHPPPQPRPGGVIDSANADVVLRRGDVLIKFAGTNSTWTEKLIEGGQKAVKALSGLFHDEIKKGDPTCFHVALYLGKGLTAEAHGGELKTAHVGTRAIDDHAGFLFRIYRSKDAGLAEQAAAVAEAWCEGPRMKYLVPTTVPIHHANFGPHAHAEALIFGQDAKRKGGPLKFTAMFCSQFVIAAFQGAVVAGDLGKKPKLGAGDVTMPHGLDLHASNASPLAFHSKLEAASEHWKSVGEVLVRRQADVNAGKAAPDEHGKDVTGKVQLLGNPTARRWPEGDWVYARNPWSLRAFDGRLYIASGNANNPDPAPNAGPIDLWVFDPKQRGDVETKGFSIEYVVDDEQVDLFRLLSDGLWIPGTDSHLTGRNDGRVNGESKADHIKRVFKTAASVPADWALGNTYHRRAKGWERLRSVPNGIHVYDVLEHGGALFAATSTVAGGALARSEDRGLSWKDALTKPLPWSRTRSLFVLEDFGKERLFCSTNGAAVYRYEPDQRGVSEVPEEFFPGASTAKADRKEMFVARPTAFAGQVVYIGARKLIDHDWTPIGLFAAAKIDKARPVPLPGGALARALVVHDGNLYALTSTQPSPTETRVHVFSTGDLKEWIELFNFHAPTFARSFDLLDGDFYCGLGCDPERLVPETGRILRVPRAAWS